LNLDTRRVMFHILPRTSGARGRDVTMNEVTRLLKSIGQGDPRAARVLLPLVYDELRRLAARKLAHEAPGQTLQATALVHEAYARLIGPDTGDEPRWDGRGHFFAAAAEVMRRILVENARRKQSVKHSGGRARQDLAPDALADRAPAPSDDLLALDEALDRLAAAHPAKAELVKLRYFAGLTLPQAAEILGISPATADRAWAFARAWLRREITGGGKEFRDF
jgi:RNA polymerase sigma factor (TIGR02999 family)